MKHFQQEIFQLQIIKTNNIFVIITCQFFFNGCFPHHAINMVSSNAARSSQFLHVCLSHTEWIIECELNFVLYPGLQKKFYTEILYMNIVNMKISRIMVCHGISKCYFFGCRQGGCRLEIMKHSHHQHHKLRCWRMLIEVQSLGFVKHCCTYMWPFSLNDLRLTEGTSLGVKYWRIDIDKAMR